MLTGREHFYGDWQARVRRVVEHGPVLDVGTPRPFNKDIAWLSPSCAHPYFTSDIQEAHTITFTSDVCALPVRDASLGAVICQHVLNYLIDPHRAVDEIWRVLRPGGRAYVTLSAVAPYTEGFESRGDVIRFTPASTSRALRTLRGARRHQGGWDRARSMELPPRRSARRPAPTTRQYPRARALRTNVTMGLYAFATK